jgi:hypothetical protein
MVTFLFVYLAIARPTTQQLNTMRQQLSTLESTLCELADQRGSVEEGNSLLSLLARQQSEVAEAQAALVQMSRLHGQLMDEAEHVPAGLNAVAQFSALQDALLASASSQEIKEAADAVAQSESLWQRLASASETVDVAIQTGVNLLSLQEELIQRGQDSRGAFQALDGLTKLCDSLAQQHDHLTTAQARVDDLLVLKDTIVSQTSDLADAVETLELTHELNLQFTEAAASFERIRHWLVEVVATEPLLQRARQTLEPLSELTSLRHLDPHRLREMARAVCQESRTAVARKPPAP